MIDKLEYKGFWYLPENPENEISGTLTFDPQIGCELELMGRLKEFKSSKEIHEPNIILGYTTNGKLITLYKCFETNRSMSIPGMETCKYYVNFILRGAHFNSELELNFDTITGRLKNLENWISEFGFKKVQTDFDTNTTEINYQLPKPIKFNPTSTLNGQLKFSSTAPFSTNVNRIEIEQKVSLILKSECKKPFEELLADFFHFQNFITLGTFEASYPLSLFVHSNSLKQDTNGNKLPIYIDLFFKPTAVYKITKKKILWEYLFSYKDISDNFDEIVKQWFENKIKIKPVTDILFDNFYNTGRFSENNFLNISQAIETFHRRFRKNEILSKEEHKVKITEILQTVNKKHKKWLQDRLNFSNEPTLHMRLKELIDELSNNTVKKIIKDVDQFIKDVKNSRNYYTHYDSRLEKKAKKGVELFYLSEKLKVILICAVLKSSGFSSQKIESLLERNEWKYFNHILS